MHVQLINKILEAGREAAYAKMSLGRNLEKPDMRTLSFYDLQLFLEHEIEELAFEVFARARPESEFEKTLNAIRNEAGDVIAFASGIAAKCDQELDKIRNEDIPYLFENKK